ncbi:HupE/UreJ family protein [Rhodovarius crocodyli]|uniref:HupE/UreJ family protein n=2 Tax=Rhodovarius crocodyli TaxID=1979269 RepID=A0A437MFJ5_9PROT|nr:HupE/UreJ family protein [Rhodovarius crocodyli]
MRAAVVMAAMLPGMALAHPGHGADGLVHGLAHPLLGLDHVLAMVLVGVMAAQLSGRALWLVPASFLLVMALGGVMGAAGVALPFVEAGIALSVIVLGAAVAFGLRAPLAVAMGLAGLFALFHGHAHGAEIPENAGGLAYAAGFLAATALLHGLGVLAGRLRPAALRVAGGAAALAGVVLLLG